MNVEPSYALAFPKYSQDHIVVVFAHPDWPPATAFVPIAGDGPLATRRTNEWEPINPNTKEATK